VRSAQHIRHLKEKVLATPTLSNTGWPCGPARWCLHGGLQKITTHRSAYESQGGGSIAASGSAPANRLIGPANPLIAAARVDNYGHVYNSPGVGYVAGDRRSRTGHS
jgi:hypothetical protein